MNRDIRAFRYDPSSGESRFDHFRLDIPDEAATTILDVLLRIQQEQDPTLAFRFACRVAMCGSCGMVINGAEAMACKTNVSHIAPGQEITIRPLNHFPVIKDLVVDMAPFFQRFDEVLPFFEPKNQSSEIARIRPDSPERIDIGDATECIACGCCVSSCTMVQHHEGYAGPAALNRAFTLLADSRDGLFEERLTRALGSCYHCRTEFNCTEVCPKGISPSRAIKHIQRLALRDPAPAPALATGGTSQEAAPDRDRRGFPQGLAAKVIGALAAATFAGVGMSIVVGPAVQTLFTGRSEWAMLALGMALLVAVPLLGRTAVRVAAHRPLAVSAGVTCTMALLYLTCIGIAATRPHGQTFLVADRQLTASETRGLYLYANLECAYCHQIRGTGGHRTGPDLSNMVAKGRTGDYLATYIRDPQMVAVMSTMPKYKLPEPDLRALAEFLLALDFGAYPSKIVKREEVLHE